MIDDGQSGKVSSIKLEGEKNGDRQDGSGVWSMPTGGSGSSNPWVGRD